MSGYVQFNFLLYSVLLFLLVMCLYLGRSIPKELRSKTLNLVIIIAIAESVIEAFWISIGSYSFGLIVVYGSMLIAWLMIVFANKFYLVELKIMPDTRQWSTVYFLLCTPITVLLIIDPITGFLFRLDKISLSISKGPYCGIYQTILFAIPIFMIICAVIQALRFKKRNGSDYLSSRFVLDSLIISVVFSVTQILFFYDAYSSMLPSALGFVYLYIRKNSELLADMRAEKAAVEAELEAAKKIQTSLVPSVFPAFPDNTEFDIRAALFPSKSVGGDFYDFYMPDSDHLVLTVGDVSGSGMAAALFMAMSKAQIKSCYAIGMTAAEILSKANNIISSDNKEQVFVTVWLGILELSTGKMDCANAGHEYPVLRRNGGEFEIYKDKHGFVLGAVPGMKYTSYSIQLAPGDLLFMYTDGIPEASSKDAFLGMDGMLNEMNRIGDVPPQELISKLRSAIEDFAEDTPQSDDIAMLYLKYKGVM